jgi:hypothetical protein
VYVMCCIVFADSLADRRPTVLRSIRIDPTISEVLARDAANEGMSVNALVSQILTKYVEWDRFADRFGFVTITREGYRSMHDLIPDADLERVAQQAGGAYPKETALFFFKHLGLDVFLKYLELTCRYARWAEFELTRGSASITVVLRHSLGPKYSRFLGAYLRSAAKELARVPVRTEIHPGSVVLHLSP